MSRDIVIVGAIYRFGNICSVEDCEFFHLSLLAIASRRNALKYYVQYTGKFEVTRFRELHCEDSIKQRNLVSSKISITVVVRPRHEPSFHAGGLSTQYTCAIVGGIVGGFSLYLEQNGW